MSASRSRSRSQKRGSSCTPNSRKISDTTNTTSTKSTGPYNRNFQQNLVDGGVNPHAYRYPDGHVPAKPHNWEEISHRLTQPRSSLSPSKFSEEAHQKFVQADADAVKEKQVCASVIPVIEGNIADSKCTSGGIPFTNLDHLTDGTLVPGNPDVYYGARPEQLDRTIVPGPRHVLKSFSYSLVLQGLGVAGSHLPWPPLGSRDPQGWVGYSPAVYVK